MKNPIKTQLLLATILLALIAASACESKTSKPDQNGVAEQKGDAAEKAAPEEDQAGTENTKPAAEQADGEAIPTLSDDALNPLLLEPAKVTQGEAPKTFDAKFITSQGDFTVQFVREWGPIGVDRAYQLIKADYYDGISFFRVIPGFMAQFGIHANPKVSAAWQNERIKDDPVTQSNTRGMVTFAKTNMPDSRLTHLFINYGNNASLDGQGFAPVGKVVEGMEVVEKLYGGYGGGPPTGPNQGALTEQGNPYLQQKFPKLDYIKDVVILGEENAE